MTTQFQVVASQVHSVRTQENRKVGPRVKQKVRTMAFLLRVFTRMNRQMFFGSKENEEPQDFIDKVKKILYAIGVSSNEKAKLVSSSRIWLKRGIHNHRQ